MPNFNPDFRENAQTHTNNYGIFKVDLHVIASQHGVHLIGGRFLMGNPEFIRATKSTGLVAQLLKQVQPALFFNFEH